MSMDEMRTSPSPSDDISQHQCSDASSDHSDTSRDGIRSSSPLLPETDPTTVEHPPNMKKKRSLDEMNEQPEDTFASSATIMGDVPSSAVRANAADLPHSNKPSVIAHSMLPPPKPASSASLPYQTTPTSAQVPQSPRSGDNEMGSSTFGQREKAPSPGPHNAPLSDDSQDSSSDPRERMEDFDWNGLHESYHDTTERLNEEEQKVIADFNRLCQVGLRSWIVFQLLTLA